MNGGIFFGLSNFSLKRTAKQAVGFYIVYLVLLIVLAVVVGLVAGAVLNASNSSITNSFASSFSFGIGLGAVISVVCIIILGILILKGKKSYKNPVSIICVLIAIVLGVFGGALLGLIPLAYLTTRKNGPN